ncbi:hypothetical protein BGW38_005252 [Lunasporangiospora selenospora]|uniref:Protein YIP n=1 Tax=Lunasporangiospora selenospora TaxID=979761 RepID=A0A9P6FNP2_9FUNG|nr:hypothetical protein BGW38_005252 [Lunasporangiospora selenospora]
MASKGAYSAIEIDDDELQFQTFESSASSPNATGNLSSNSNTPQQRPAGFSGGAFDPHRTIQDQVLSKPFWSVEYYSKFFDVDTSQVVERCTASIIPKESFNDVMAGSPDLYGPFWVSTTVILVLFVASSIVESINAYMKGTPYMYDFRQLTFAFGIIYSYAFLVPTIIWGGTKYLGCQPDLLELLALYGYSFTVWVPVSVFVILPIDWVRWLLVISAAGSSGMFLLKNLYPVLSRAEAHTSKIALISVILLHTILAIVLKHYFFVYDVLKAPAGNEGTKS